MRASRLLLAALYALAGAFGLGDNLQLETSWGSNRPRRCGQHRRDINARFLFYIFVKCIHSKDYDIVLILRKPKYFE
jgi:hypothetical protein